MKTPGTANGRGNGSVESGAAAGGVKSPEKVVNYLAPFKRLAEATLELIKKDDRVGFPRHKPDVEPESFGYLFTAQETLLHYLLREETRIVIQVGAWLGKTTRFLCERAPKALIFVVDEWDNDALRAEPILNKNYANIDLFERVPFYETYLHNVWDRQAKEQEDGRLIGVVPMRMGWNDALPLLKGLDVRPDVLYWEGIPREKDLRELLLSVKAELPGCVVVGDNYDKPEVERVVRDVASEFRTRPHVEVSKCWTFAKVNEDRLKDIRDMYNAPVNKPERTVLTAAVTKSNFKDLLSGLRATSDGRKRDEEEERMRRRRQEQEERERQLEKERIAEDEVRRAELARRALESGARGRGRGRGGRGRGRGGDRRRTRSRSRSRSRSRGSGRRRSAPSKSGGGRERSSYGGDGRREGGGGYRRSEGERGDVGDGFERSRKRGRSRSRSEGDDGNRRFRRRRDEDDEGEEPKEDQERDDVEVVVDAGRDVSVAEVNGGASRSGSTVQKGGEAREEREGENKEEEEDDDDNQRGWF